MSLHLPRPRTLLISTAAIVVGTVALLGSEVYIAFSGPASAQPPGSADGVVGSGTGRPIRLVVLGDSTGAAVGAGDVILGYPHRIAARVAHDLNRTVDLRVLAVSGARIADVRSAQLPQVAALNPDVILMAVGANDVVHLTNSDDARRDLRFVIAGLRATGAHVVVSGVPAMGTVGRAPQPLRALLGLTGKRYDGIWQDETAAAGVTRVDLAAQTEEQFTNDPTMLSMDSFHPSAAGYAVWAEVLGPAVEAAARDVPV